MTQSNTSARPLILISNDDGVDAPGIHCLVDYVSDLADIIVVAPDRGRSGMSAAFTINEPLRINARPDYGKARFFSVNGTPVDCIKLALHAIVPRRPNLVLAGINHGSNSGCAVVYSGTMGAAIEGALSQIPSIGFSLLHHSIKADFSLSALYITQITSTVLEKGLPDGVCLNVNIPPRVVPEDIRVCRAARGRWTNSYSRYLDPQGNPFFMPDGRFVNDEPDATDTDIYWLDRNFISIVPVTAHASSEPSSATLKSISSIFGI